jgi:predicted dinucleotide-utilizing enzyme
VSYNRLNVLLHFRKFVKKVSGAIGALKFLAVRAHDNVCRVRTLTNAKWRRSTGKAFKKRRCVDKVIANKHAMRIHLAEIITST